MGTLSSEERDERLKHHLLASKELHPALISPESEYKVYKCSNSEQLFGLQVFLLFLVNFCVISNMF